MADDVLVELARNMRHLSFVAVLGSKLVMRGV
jgi:hypothetical protein